MRIDTGFQIVPYQLPAPYETHSASSLRSLLKRLLPPDAHADVERDLQRCSDRHLEFKELCLLADGPENAPRLLQYDHLGRRIDRLQTSEGWRRLKGVFAEEGMVAIPYERRHGAWSRVHSFAKLILLAPDSQVVDCPISMTDGAARVLELVGSDAIRTEWRPKLVSRDPQVAIQAGQWMTERPGGSDLSQTETVATELRTDGGGFFTHSLNGFKWFSSATDGHVALALARMGSTTAPLGLFLVPIRNPDGTTNGIHVHRLKRKIGTHALPTAELELEGAKAHLLSKDGIKAISSVLNITRMHSAVGAVSVLGRSLDIAVAYSQVREVGGRKLVDLPLHTRALARVDTLHRALLHLVVNLSYLLGVSETEPNDRDSDLLRLLTPVAKAFVASRVSGGIEECMEALGGLGYQEEVGIGRMLRDTLVERIWEGTQNVLALDVQRVFKRSPYAYQHFSNRVRSVIERGVKGVNLQIMWRSLTVLDRSRVQSTLAREVLNVIGYVASATFSIEHVHWSGSTAEDKRALRLWLRDGEWAACLLELESPVSKL